MGLPRKICNTGGCNNLAVEGKTYCEQHLKQITGEGFIPGYKRNPDKIKFYSSHRWNKTRNAFRKANPLCEDCKQKGIITPVQMVHHEPELDDLIEQGLDPCDWTYLHSLCNRCHLNHLRNKRASAKDTKKEIKMGEGVPKSLKHLLIYR